MLRKFAAFVLFITISITLLAAAKQDSQEETGKAETKVLQITRISEPVKIDGKLDEPFYTALSPSSGFFQYNPKNGEKMTYETLVYAYYDQHNIYFAFICFDDQPGKIAADVTPFGAYTLNDDIKIYLDTFSDKETFDMFTVNPRGIKGGKETVWDADAQINTDGWTAEFKIPFKSLRFPVRAVQEWKINFRRVINRLNEVGFWTHVTREKLAAFGDTFGALEGLRGIKGGKNLEVFPYAGLRYSYSGDEKDNKFAYGVDLKYGITSNLNLNLTSSPDYSEVESDPFFYQTSPYEVYLQEMRPFYQESSDYFETVFDLFYSRRIGDPLLAAKITGKEKGFALGALGAVNDNENTGKKDFHGVFRLKKDILKLSYVGMIYTSLEGEDNWNRNIGLDFKITFLDNFNLSGMAAFSYNKDRPRQDNGMYNLSLTRTVDTGFAMSAKYTRVEPGVCVPAGYLSNVDYEYLGSYWKYTFRREGKWLETIMLTLYQYYKSSPSTGLKVLDAYEFMLFFTTRNQLALAISRQIGQSRARVYNENDELAWGGQLYPYNYYFMELSYFGSRYWEFICYVLDSEQFVYNEEFTETKEGKYIEAIARLKIKFSPRLHWNLKYGKTYYRSLDKTISFDGNLISSDLNFQLNKKLSSFIKFQYDSYLQRFQYDFLIGYEPANVSKIYLSIKNYSEERFRLFSPGARSIALKVSYLLRF